MPTSVKTRSYRSPKRQQLARARRTAVLSAARDLFVAKGYAETSVADVAARAGVSVDTVYASVGRKPQLLLAVHDMVLARAEEPLPAEQRDYVVAIREAEGARAKITTYAEALGQRLPSTAPLARALRVAALTDDACHRLVEAIDDRRRTNMGRFARELRETGDLREDLSDAWVADLVWSMNSPEYFELVTSRERTPEDYVALVVEVWSSTLLSPEVS